MTTETENTRLSDIVKLEEAMDQFSYVYENFTKEGMRLPTIERAAAGIASILMQQGAVPTTLGDSIYNILTNAVAHTQFYCMQMGLEDVDVINEVIQETNNFIIGTIMNDNDMLDRFDDAAYRKHLNVSLSNFITEKADDQTERVQNQVNDQRQDEPQGVLAAETRVAGSLQASAEPTRPSIWQRLKIAFTHTHDI